MECAEFVISLRLAWGLCRIGLVGVGKWVQGWDLEGQGRAS